MTENNFFENINQIEEKLRSMEQVKPVSIRKEERKFACLIFFAIVGPLLLLTVIFLMFWNFLE